MTPTETDTLLDVSPRYLAGAGDEPGEALDLLTKNRNWPHHIDPETSSLFISSPCHRIRVAFMGDDMDPWQIVASSEPMDAPNWMARFSGYTPVEIVGAFLETIAGNLDRFPEQVFNRRSCLVKDTTQLLEQAGWKREFTGNVIPVTSPDGLAGLANTICETFERQPLVSMTHEIPRFTGSGLYALYYRGTSIELYAPLAHLQIPVYAGQALSSNSATGERVREKYPLHRRLKQHRISIMEGGLPIGEFRFRALLLPDVHADLGENGLRVGYKPVWNSKLTGFGAKEQGPTTRQSKKSKWDTVHDGRRRTHGGVSHDTEELITVAKAHIERQVTGHDALPWRHPEADTLLDLAGPETAADEYLTPHLIA